MNPNRHSLEEPKSSERFAPPGVSNEARNIGVELLFINVNVNGELTHLEVIRPYRLQFTTEAIEARNDVMLPR